MTVAQIYDDGQTFSPDVLDVGEEQLLSSLQSAIRTITTISLATNFPTLPSVMHSVVNSYKNMIAIALETEYGWSEIEELKDRVANPEAYAAAAPAAEAAKGEETKEAAKEESEPEESEDEGGFGDLFG
ncbi:60S acidic ribosomal protein P0 [Histoplasma capsulatum G186AR]|uniref:60S acidic ribosomal protein P0 n=2 Tax=Ajellomyces capsulatus TaxID=5037 RepID=C0NC89_AJECG|nr:60S acidic ribosomal protein P0 [Histoplasma capsulatum G186AR]EEH11280.1 60S acidic ribosomal protein P0 [Histoplasma capsulatum G186AR]KAG5302879.1 60S acidic ribosomal protein P0 [Histoplasma capsulatum]QSS71721.1 60S acidic ribosomal protein P0 [Histoplasma capsulatum G186AR]